MWDNVTPCFQETGGVILVAPNGYNTISQNGHVANVETEFIFSDVEIMQYTGLKDKNGKEIYEGDIVMHHYHHQKAIIEWINCGLVMKYFDKLKDSLYAIDMEHIEIIGNLYEHPHLLNAKESTEKES